MRALRASECVITATTQTPPPPQGICIGRGGGTPPPLQGTKPLSPSRQVPASMAFVTDSNRPQPLWQPPATACLTASEAPSLLMHPCPPPPDTHTHCESAHRVDWQRQAVGQSARHLRDVGPQLRAERFSRTAPTEQDTHSVASNHPLDPNPTTPPPNDAANAIHHPPLRRPGALVLSRQGVHVKGVLPPDYGIQLPEFGEPKTGPQMGPGGWGPQHRPPPPHNVLLWGQRF